MLSAFQAITFRFFLIAKFTKGKILFIVFIAGNTPHSYTGGHMPGILVLALSLIIYELRLVTNSLGCYKVKMKREDVIS